MERLDAGRVERLELGRDTLALVEGRVRFVDAGLD